MIFLTSKQTGKRFAVDPHDVVGIEETEDGCQVMVYLVDVYKTIKIVESFVVAFNRVNDKSEWEEGGLEE